jgi:hypothetical protein
MVLRNARADQEMSVAKSRIFFQQVPPKSATIAQSTH